MVGIDCSDMVRSYCWFGSDKVCLVFVEYDRYFVQSAGYCDSCWYYSCLTDY